MCDAIVVQVGMGSGSQLGFGGPGSAGGDGRGQGGGQRRGAWYRQGLVVVFERAQLPIELLQLPVLLRLQGHHLFDVPERETETETNIERERRRERRARRGNIKVTE